MKYVKGRTRVAIIDAAPVNHAYLVDCLEISSKVRIELFTGRAVPRRHAPVDAPGCFGEPGRAYGVRLICLRRKFPNKRVLWATTLERRAEIIERLLRAHVIETKREDAKRGFELNEANRDIIRLRNSERALRGAATRRAKAQVTAA